MVSSISIYKPTLCLSYFYYWYNMCYYIQVLRPIAIGKVIFCCSGMFKCWKMGWCHLWMKLQKKIIVIPIPKEKLVPLIRNWHWLHVRVVTFETRVAHISYILLQFHSIVYEATLQKKKNNNKQTKAIVT